MNASGLDSITLEYFKVFLSSPVVIALIIFFFLFMCRKLITGFIKGIKDIKYKDLEIIRKDTNEDELKNVSKKGNYYTRIHTFIITDKLIIPEVLEKALREYMNKLSVDILDYIIFAEVMYPENLGKFRVNVIVVLSDFIELRERENHLAKIIDNIDLKNYKIEGFGSNLIKR